MVGLRMRLGLLGLGLSGLLALPAAAQGWPGESGPTGDQLGMTIRQFERLRPPPVETGMGERAVPDLTTSDLPIGSVDVGLPMIGAPPPVVNRTSARRVARRDARRRSQGNVTAVRSSEGPSYAETRSQEESRIDRLERELAARGRQIEQLQQQIDQERQQASEPRSAAARPAGSPFSINPAAAATVTPR
jgi:hypothetical protein